MEDLEFKEIEGLRTETLTLNFGPSHPATHGTLHLEMILDGERVVKVTPHIGYLHTGMEKQGEYQRYQSFLTYTDRMNYLSPFCNNLAYILSVEKLFDLKVPKRADYLRVIMAELSRIGDHLISIGTAALDVGAYTAFLYYFIEKEKIYDLFEMATGHRFTLSYPRIGGMFRDVDNNFLNATKEFLKELPRAIKDVETLLNRNKIWLGRTKDISKISGEEAIDWSITGPVLRATGVAHDVRKVEPYCLYEEFDFEIPVGENGDVYDRYLVRTEEMKQSIRIIEQAIENMPEGPVDIDNHKIRVPPKKEVFETMEGLIHSFEYWMENKGIKPPKGEIYVPTEAPNGELGFFIVSDGSNRPYRIKTRPPSFINFQIFPKLLEGHMLSDAVAILGSMNIIAGELDR